MDLGILLMYTGCNTPLMNSLTVLSAASILTSIAIMSPSFMAWFPFASFPFWQTLPLNQNIM